MSLSGPAVPSDPEPRGWHPADLRPGVPMATVLTQVSATGEASFVCTAPSAFSRCHGLRAEACLLIQKIDNDANVFALACPHVPLCAATKTLQGSGDVLRRCSVLLTVGKVGYTGHTHILLNQATVVPAISCSESAVAWLEQSPWAWRCCSIIYTSVLKSRL